MMKRGGRIAQLRSILRQAEDGMTISQITQACGIDRPHASRILRRMPDAYIDRWLKHPRTYEAVWAVVVPPENCPKPMRDKNEKAN
jgi:DNA-binding transcriptional regulator GbsR (MarR family)